MDMITTAVPAPRYQIFIRSLASGKYTIAGMYENFPLN